MIANTDVQAESEEWHTCCWLRITASIAKQANNLGNILNLHGDSADMQKFQPFLRNSIWGLNQYRSKDMQYGIENEDETRSDYLKFMRSSVPEISVEKTGFWVNNLWPELDCSPDGLVTDPSEVNKDEPLEIKCPNIFKEIAPKDLFNKINNNEVKKCTLYNCCFGIPLNDNTTLELKTTHNYYYQVQFQMAITGRSWCDFVL
jgi:hypothetical protein